MLLAGYRGYHPLTIPHPQNFLRCHHRCLNLSSVLRDGSKNNLFWILSICGPAQIKLIIGYLLSEKKIFFGFFPFVDLHKLN